MKKLFFLLMASLILTGSLYGQFPDGWYHADVIIKDHTNGTEAVYYFKVKAKEGEVVNIQVNDSVMIYRNNPSYHWTGGKIHYTEKDKMINSATALVYIRQKDLIVSYMIIIK